MNLFAVVGVIVIGIVAGFLWEQVSNRRQTLPTNVLVGLLGALAGLVAAEVLSIGFLGVVGALMISTIGAGVLLALLSFYRRGMARPEP